MTPRQADQALAERMRAENLSRAKGERSQVNTTSVYFHACKDRQRQELEEAVLRAETTIEAYERLSAQGYALLRQAHELFMANRLWVSRG